MGSIELGSSIIKAGVKTIIDVRVPSRRETVLFGGRSNVEKSVVEKYISRHKRWASLIGFMSNFGLRNGLSHAEVSGLTDVMLLIMTTDEIIDRPGKFKQGMSATEFENALKKEPIEGTYSPEGIPYTVGQFLDVTEKRFSANQAKQQALRDYLNKAIEVQTTLVSQIPGEYSYDASVAYREATNSAGLDMAFFLADIRAPHLLEAAKRHIRFVQLKDDLEDVGQDFHDHSINLFIGMATSQYPQELERLQIAMSNAASENQKFMPNTVWIKENMPDTFAGYQARMDQERVIPKSLAAVLAAPKWLLRRGR